MDHTVTVLTHQMDMGLLIGTFIGGSLTKKVIGSHETHCQQQFDVPVDGGEAHCRRDRLNALRKLLHCQVSLRLLKDVQDQLPLYGSAMLPLQEELPITCHIPPPSTFTFSHYAQVSSLWPPCKTRCPCYAPSPLAV